ncbi:MAG: efflux RND transporter periplasmic adaptor subunit [Sedimentisphaerales bacterium]
MRKKYAIYIIIALILIAAIAVIAYRHFFGAGSESEKGPVAKVQVVTLERGKIEKTITAFGTVVAAIGKTQTYSVPFESQVRQVLVTAGQTVDVNTPLIEISPSPESLLKFAQAHAERDTAKNNIELVTQRVEMKLATRQDMVSAQQSYEAAELNLKSMEEQGSDKNKTILAGSKGLVSQISVEQGQIVPAGTPMIATIGEDQISVILGVENEDIGLLQTGQDVRLYQVNTVEKKMINGKIGLVTHRVNQQTRMVDVFVIPQSGKDLLLNQYVEVNIIIKSAEGFLVPCSAVLPEDSNYVLYTVDKDHAVKHVVNIGLKNSQQVEVISDELQQGQQVVVAGNYELENDMSVNVEQKQ